MKRLIYSCLAVLALAGAWLSGHLGLGSRTLAPVAAAQTVATPVPTAAPPTQPQKADRSKYASAFLDHLAAKLGIDRAKLDQALRDASTQTIDQALADGTLTAQQATKLRDRASNFPDSLSGLPLGKLGHGPAKAGRPSVLGGIGGRGFPALDGAVDAVATKLGLTSAELRTELQQGKSLLALAQAKGISEADLRTTISTAIKPQLDAAVTAGKLTQAQADQLLQKIQTAPLDRSLLPSKGRRR